MKAFKDRFVRRADGRAQRMRWRTPVLLIVIAALYAGFAAPQAGAQTDVGEKEFPPAHFVLSITPQGVFVPQPDTAVVSDRVVLACNPDGGTHPDSGDACDSLRDVNGYFERLGPDGNYVCTLEYAPVKVEAIGYWGERKVDYSEVFSNRCFAAVGTDFVFQF